jgi:ribosomal protein S12 methylthiotransferase
VRVLHHPTLRGNYRSRPADSIVREARALAARGVKELLLISQDTTFYGIDRGERGALARLLRELNTVDGLEVDPAALPLPDDHRRGHAGGDGRLRQSLQVHRPAAAARLGCRAQAHEAPGQSENLRSAAHADRTRVPGVALRTTFIVGFPGETEADLANSANSCPITRSTTWAFHLFPRGGHLRVRAARRRPARNQEGAARPRHAPAEGAWFSAIAPHCRSARPNRPSTGRRRPRTSSSKAGWAGQAPDIDAGVVLTDCDPSAIARAILPRSSSSAPEGKTLIARPTEARSCEPVEP